MRLIINKPPKKRSIETPFKLCAHREDIQRLVVRLQSWLEMGVSYGWIEIPSHMEVLPNSPVEP